jgi:nucleoside 2-deoxyribosyltransferase
VRVYLAGPDVFLPNPEARALALKSICARYGLIGVSPLDTPDDVPEAWRKLPFARFIALCNEAHIRACDALIANLTPFRGPSADVGTVFEIGFMRALGRPVWGWSNVSADFFARSRAAFGAEPDGPEAWRDRDGMLLETFGMTDNLMIDGAMHASGGAIITGDVPLWTDLTVFERCVAQVAARPYG